MYKCTNLKYAEGQFTREKSSLSWLLPNMIVKRGAKVHFLSNHSSAPDSASSHLQLYSIITMSTFFTMFMFVLTITIIIFAIILHHHLHHHADHDDQQAGKDEQRDGEKQAKEVELLFFSPSGIFDDDDHIRRSTCRQKLFRALSKCGAGGLPSLVLIFFNS